MDCSRIMGIYLAAGKSLRMRREKLNLPIDETILGAMAFKAALEAQLDVTIAVTRKGNMPLWLTPFLKKEGWKRVEVEGEQSDSLKKGVLAAIECGAEGVVVLLGDQPFVTAMMINQLLIEFRHNPELLFIAFSHKGIIKPPILIAKELFPAVMQLSGDKGARSLLRGKWKNYGKCLGISEDWPFLDIDTEEDYQSFISQ